jgi:hypothetical protein
MSGGGSSAFHSSAERPWYWSTKSCSGCAAAVAFSAHCASVYRTTGVVVVVVVAVADGASSDDEQAAHRAAARRVAVIRLIGPRPY